MIFFYNLVIRLYFFFIFIASFFNAKARLWLSGRRSIFFQIARQIDTSQQHIWFHFSSLGEFEQGRSVLEGLKKQRPGHKIIVTFFSPSGYEIRKNHPLADHVFYLPLDTASNARKFISLINPRMAVFTKYDYWYHYFKTLSQQQIPLYLISGIFQPEYVFFKWYGGFHRKILRFVTHFFVQNKQSKQLLSTINILNITISGDTRFDSVAENASLAKKNELIIDFCADAKVFIAGSTWPEDEKLIAKIVERYPNWKFIIAPHEIDENHINHLVDLLPIGKAVRYSILTKENRSPATETGDKAAAASIRNTQYSILIIDNIGMLSQLYQYSDIAYIGGGFGAGIHNTLEAAAFGLPVIFGPEHHKFQEAKDLIGLGAAFSITDFHELSLTMEKLQDEGYSQKFGNKAREYVEANTGATELILNHLLKNS